MLAFFGNICYYTLALASAYAPIAQLDRVTDYESVGRGFESLSAYQTNIIRTRFSELEKGSDYLFISPVTSKPISLTAGRYGPNRSPVAQERRSPNK